MKNLEAAETAFRNAARAHPENGAPLNNLAHVLAELGRYEEALEAIDQAVAIGGPQEATFRQTREEIRRMVE